MLFCDEKGLKSSEIQKKVLEGVWERLGHHLPSQTILLLHDAHPRTIHQSIKIGSFVEIQLVQKQTFTKNMPKRCITGSLQWRTSQSQRERGPTIASHVFVFARSCWPGISWPMCNCSRGTVILIDSRTFFSHRFSNRWLCNQISGRTRDIVLL